MNHRVTTWMMCALPVLAALPQGAGAQDIGGFLDYRNYFYGFEKGRITELETLPPRAFGMGGGHMVYATSGGDVKVFSDGKVRKIDQGIGAVPWVTDHYFGYNSAHTLKVFDGNELRVLSTSAARAVVEDSLAAWFDDRAMTLNVYYDGETQQIGDALMENPVKKWRSGDNTLAWLDQQTRKFNVFYRGEIHTPATLVSDMKFEAGLDVVAYQDPSDMGLKAFFKGEVIDVEALMPEKVVMGRGLFAYVDVSGALKVFQNGTVTTALDFEPDEFFVRDSLVIINDKGYMRVHANGVTGTLLPYWPDHWKASWGTIAWLDNTSSLNVWHNGVTTQVMQKEPVKSFVLDRGLLVITLTVNKVKIVWRGQVYDHE